MAGRFVIVWLSAIAARPCECTYPSVVEAKKSADIVFRGTITDISGGTVFFKVARVWKGVVGKQFTMPEIRETSACVGFWPAHLQAGNELLVYADWLPPKSKDGAFFTSICTRTRLIEDATEGLRRLGQGHSP